MKKVLAIVFLSVLCAWPAAAQAQGIEAGDQTVSVFLGGAAPVNESGVKVYTAYSSDELDWGDAAVSYGAQYLYALTPYFAFGAEFNGNNFDDAEYDYRAYSGFSSQHYNYQSSMNVYNFMAAGRFTVNPQANTRFYIPFGLGVASAKGKIKIDASGVVANGSGEVSGTSTSFAYYIGAGLEGNLNENWILGAEARYQGFQFDNGKYDVDGLSGKQDLGFVSVLLKLSYKF